MLPDIERKVLRIVINCSHFGKVELPLTRGFLGRMSQWTGRDEKSIRDILLSLQSKGYLKMEGGHIVNAEEKPLLFFE